MYYVDRMSGGNFARKCFASCRTFQSPPRRKYVLCWVRQSQPEMRADWKFHQHARPRRWIMGTLRFYFNVRHHHYYDYCYYDWPRCPARCWKYDWTRICNELQHIRYVCITCTPRLESGYIYHTYVDPPIGRIWILQQEAAYCNSPSPRRKRCSISEREREHIRNILYNIYI